MSQLEKTLGDWYPLYTHTTETFPKEFDLLKRVLATSRATKTVYPDGTDVFKAFELCQLADLKVVIIGQDPYHNGAANGLAFGVNPSFNVNPSLRVIHNEVFTSHNLEDEINPEEKEFDFTLTNWASQGVLLLNNTLTVVKGNPNTHEPYWRFFTQDIVKQIAETKESVVFMLWGKFAVQAFEPIVKQAIEEHGKFHKIIKAPHPAAEVYGSMKAGFTGSNCFVKCNQFLDTFTTPIKWIGKIPIYQTL
jgi:uracil-DNA glycosylase